MANRQLSAREQQVIALCVDGHTNESIAHELGLSVGTVKNYWLRIMHKVGGVSRADTAVKAIRLVSECELRDSNAELARLHGLLEESRKHSFDILADNVLPLVMMDQTRWISWLADRDLVIRRVAINPPLGRCSDEAWQLGKTISEAFSTAEPSHQAVSVHLDAIGGKRSEVRLSGALSGTVLWVQPLCDDTGIVLGCVGMLSEIGAIPTSRRRKFTRPAGN